MIGGLFAGTDEAPGEIELYQGRSYKSYRGMGSLGAMAQRHGSSDRYFQDATSELRSWCPRASRAACPTRAASPPSSTSSSAASAPAMGYTGCGTIDEMRTKPDFVRITGAGIRESHVHDVTITKEAPNYRTET